ncbi:MULTISPECIES: tRNA uridine-5-carboxymethylaminomethyl(34) synthesis GTPase MnmE [unclassified Xanthobacter]|uniref:tRNA uridine-5-carboxymethylaminomethyl(34) synthesis GTPase MnmE n=1 Tax=unclassified Xanthobacter TaxID=2623496 RepID=UPI001F21522D|nr:MULTISPECIES: tRNA uridine-5-carboxymethylaminomethyl(34) synthesis GTPase MnmE [unclassified Xanthobacter]
MAADSIFALSSGRLPSGVAVVRISGPAARNALLALCGEVPAARQARYGALRDPRRGEVLDRGLQLFFPAPASATGEDIAELHLHGGRAVVAAVLSALSAVPGLRPAEAGEFTRRAHANGKLDLSEVEGLADLIAAESEAQRRQALAQASGALSRRVENWRGALLWALAMTETGLDFADEGDVEDRLKDDVRQALAPVVADMEAALRDSQRGERVRDGVTIAIAGPPNAGKSSLLNRLAGRDVAIVSPIAGTTRDVLEVHLELSGQSVLLLDTAGLRETADQVESEGVRRALARAEEAQLVLWLSDDAAPPPPGLGHAVLVRSKMDLGGVCPSGWIALSTNEEAGLEALLGVVCGLLEALVGGEPALITRERQRRALDLALGYLRAVVENPWVSDELQAEELRLAARALDRTIGRIDVEDVLEHIFSTFCIGK